MASEEKDECLHDEEQAHHSHGCCRLHIRSLISEPPTAIYQTHFASVHTANTDTWSLFNWTICQRTPGYYIFQVNRNPSPYLLPLPLTSSPALTSSPGPYFPPKLHLDYSDIILLNANSSKMVKAIKAIKLHKSCKNSCGGYLWSLSSCYFFVTPHHEMRACNWSKSCRVTCTKLGYLLVGEYVHGFKQYHPPTYCLLQSCPYAQYC